MMKTNNTFEDFGFLNIIGQPISEVAITVKNIQKKVVHLILFLGFESPSETDVPKETTSTKTAKTVTEKDLFNFLQVEDKVKSQAEVNTLLVCFN